MFTFRTVFNGASFDLLTLFTFRLNKRKILLFGSIQFSSYDRSVLRILYAPVQSFLDTVSEKHGNIEAVLNISPKAK